MVLPGSNSAQHWQEEDASGPDAPAISKQK